MVNPRPNSLVPGSNIYDQSLLVNNLSVTWKKTWRTYEYHFGVERLWNSCSLWLYNPCASQSCPLQSPSDCPSDRIFCPSIKRFWCLYSLYISYYNFILCHFLSFPPSLLNLFPVPLETLILKNKDSMFPNIFLKFCSYLDALKDACLSLKATFFCRVSGTQLDQ